MDRIVKHRNEKRDLKLITCGREKTFRRVRREEELQDVFPKEQVEVAQSATNTYVGLLIADRG